jgi:hypothetical protein
MINKLRKKGKTPNQGTTKVQNKRQHPKAQNVQWEALREKIKLPSN